MTKEEILKAIEKIKNTANDRMNSSMAYIEEDDLREEFIEYVAKREDALGEKARLILSLNEVDFGIDYK